MQQCIATTAPWQPEHIVHAAHQIKCNATRAFWWPLYEDRFVCDTSADLLSVPPCTSTLETTKP
eukprot:1158649-Pelagomonas_calceolata.AAC.2